MLPDTAEQWIPADEDVRAAIRSAVAEAESDTSPPIHPNASFAACRYVFHGSDVDEQPLVR